MKSNSLWQTARIAATRDLTPTVRAFEIRPEAGPAQAWAPGAHLKLRLDVAGQRVERCYSLVGLPQDGAFHIAVKRLDNGRGGSRAMWALAAGDALEVSAPQNHFALGLQAPQTLLVAGGIGITPLVGMAQTLARLGQPVRLVYAVRSPDELAFGQELHDLLGEQLVQQVSSIGQKLDWAAELAALAPNAQAYVCGPSGLMDALRLAWAEAGRHEHLLRFETFGSGSGAGNAPFEVLMPRHHAQLTVAADASLLEALSAAGIEVLSDCLRGECGLCTLDVLGLEGEIEHRDVYLNPHERQANSRICACVSRVKGRIILDSAFRPDAI